MARGAYYSQARLEARASELLLDYARSCGACQVPPVPVEDIAERFLDLRLLWDKVPEPRGCVILAKIVPDERLVVFNENRRELYGQTPYLERTTLAHEIGHWELHMERGNAANAMSLAGIASAERQLHQQGYARMSRDEQNAHSFMGCLLMPKAEIVAAVREHPVRSLTDMYDLTRCFGVTITALQIRLERLRLAYVDSRGKVHRSREVAIGQLSFL